MAYHAPSLTDLIARAKSLQEKYLNANPDKMINPNRVHLINLLQTFVIGLDRLTTEEMGRRVAETELQDIVLGAYIYCMESIEREYRQLDPSYTPGYIFNSGSTLYKILNDELEITPFNPLNDPLRKLIYLNKFYQYALINRESLGQDFVERELNLDSIIQQVKDTIKYEFNRHNTKSILKAIPDETAIDNKLKYIKRNYINRCEAHNKKANPDRVFLTELAHAVGKVAFREAEESAEKQFLSRSQRIKMGALIFIMQSIKHEYALRSPRANSELYDLCGLILNIQNEEEIDPTIRLACLTAFKSCLQNEEMIKEVEKVFREQKSQVKYLDIKLYPLMKQLNSMVTALAVSKSHPISRLTMGLATISALMASAPGYGTGYILGHLLTETDFLLDSKKFLATYTSKGMVIVVGGVGEYLGFVSASTILDATLSRAFAKVFEALGMMFGAAAGGAVGLIVFDLSYLTLRHLCQQVFHLRENLDPLFAKDIDPALLECLISLPADIFSDEQKATLHRITQGSFVVESGPVALQETSEDDVLSHRGSLAFNRSFSGTMFSSTLARVDDTDEESEAAFILARNVITV